MTNTTIPQEFIDQLRESKRFKELKEEFKEFDENEPEDFINKYPNGVLTKFYKTYLIDDLNKFLEYRKERCYDRDIPYKGDDGKEYTYHSKAIEPLQKEALVMVYTKWLNWSIKEACDTFNLQRTFFYELKEKAERKESIKDDLDDRIYHLEKAAEEKTYSFCKMNMFKFVRICYHIHLMGLPVMKWANYEDHRTKEYKEIENLLKEAKEYSQCEDYRNLQLLEYLLTKDKSQ